MKKNILNEGQFKPHPNLKKLYYAYLTIGSLAFYLSWAVPISAAIYLYSNHFFPISISFFLLPFIAIIIFTIFWIPRFYLSLSYNLTESDIIIEMGVWWKRKTIVPYNRVTNIEIIQGPLSRKFGLGKVSIQTAGFSAGGSNGGARIAEVVILGIQNYEQVNDLILAKVKRYRPFAIESEPETLVLEEDIGFKILEELRKIRENLN